MKNLLLLIALLFAFWTCTPEEEKLTYDPDVRLRFSADTIFFDTVFTKVNTDIRNITRRLKVYNDSKNAVEIQSISLRQPASAFTIHVNGEAADQFRNTRLLGKDSLLILVQVTIDPKNKNLPFIVADEIKFITNDNEQEIQLVAWGQDAHFLKDSVLACNTVWTNDRPYVIFNSVLVDSLCTLRIEAGTKIFSHPRSYVLVKGTLNAQGTAGERIIFSNDRLDFENVPGQWGGIIFLPGSKNNAIHYADIRNAETGIYLGTPDDNATPDLVVANTTIENMGGNPDLPVTGELIMGGYGILAVTSDLYMYNTLINNCAINTVGNYAGGNYRYEHCTFANFSFDFSREDPAVVFSDNLILNNEGKLLVANLNVELVNTIIWGGMKDEILLSNGGEANFSLHLSNNLVRTTQTALADGGNILNEDPNFMNAAGYNYRLDTLSPAKDQGADVGLTKDHDGRPRDSEPDIGAFERIED